MDLQICEMKVWLNHLTKHEFLRAFKGQLYYPIVLWNMMFLKYNLLPSQGYEILYCTLQVVKIVLY